MNTTKRNTDIADSSGAAAVEFALVLPMFLTLLIYFPGIALWLPNLMFE